MKLSISLFTFLLWSSAAFGQGYVQGGVQPLGQQTVFTFTFAKPNTAPCTLFVAVRNPNFTVADSNGNTWVKDSNELYQTTTCASGVNTVTLTFTGPSYEQAVFAEYGGVLAVDGSIPALAQGTGVAAASSIIQVNAGDLVLGWGSNANSNSDAVTAGAGFTLRGDVNQYLQDEVVAVAGPTQSTVTYATADTWITSVAAFKVVTPPGPLVITIPNLATFTFLVNAVSQLPTCSATDPQPCTLQLQFCSPTNNCVMGNAGTFSIVKNAGNGAQTSTTIIVQAAP